jgi:glycosyltransferase involved in cell wall biosynthesis
LIILNLCTQSERKDSVTESQFPESQLMKILLVHNTYQEQGGEDVVFWQERDLLNAAGHQVLEYQRFNREIKDYSTVRRITLIGRTVWAPDSHRDFKSLLRQHKPDIVHVHNTFPLISPSILWACRNEQVPVVHTLHNYRLLCPGANFIREGKPCEDCITGEFWRGVVHGCYRDSRVQTAPVALMLAVHRAAQTWTRTVDRYIVLSAFALSRFVTAGLPAEKFSIKPNCVDPDPGKRKGEGSYALFVGRVSQEKGAHTLLKAWRQLPPTFSLRVVGDGPSSAELESEAAAQGLSNIKFMGRVPREQVIEAMKGARFVIFPSQLYENFPLTIIEAFACGVPVIASRLGAMQEIVEDGRTGLFFQPGDAADLARTVTRAWQEPAYMDRLGEQARREYETKYTAAVNYRQLLAIYRQVISDHQLGASQVPAPDLEEVPSA